uniref:Uncharacterized protein n=1 Tax=Eutreptiella gymnastica TaxID=73025 RepID=A0A6T2DFL4_9EUGL
MNILLQADRGTDENAYIFYAEKEYKWKWGQGHGGCQFEGATFACFPIFKLRQPPLPPSAFQNTLSFTSPSLSPQAQKVTQLLAQATLLLSIVRILDDDVGPHRCG